MTATGPVGATWATAAPTSRTGHVPVDARPDLASTEAVVLRVVELDTAFDAVEQCRRDGVESERRVTVDDRADVGIDPEDLLHDDDRRGRRRQVVTRRLRARDRPWQ